MRRRPRLRIVLAGICAVRATSMDSSELSTCSGDLRDLADYIRYNAEGCSERAELFAIDGVPLADTLDYLAMRLEDARNDCPCVGPCDQIACTDVL